MAIKLSVTTRSRLSHTSKKAILNGVQAKAKAFPRNLQRQMKKSMPRASLRLRLAKKNSNDALSTTSVSTKHSDSTQKAILNVKRQKKVISKNQNKGSLNKAIKFQAKTLKKKIVLPNKAKKEVKSLHEVDIHCPIGFKVQVFSENGKTFDKMLNQSNLDANNNKFYVIQLLNSKSDQSKFWVWNRWGRVGVEGQNALKGPMAKAKAIAEFNDKLFQKTVKGNYIEVLIDHGQSTQKVAKGLQNLNSIPISKPMSAEVRDLVKLIFDENMLNIQLKSTGYDNQKMPLGKLSQEAINEGYKVLSSLLKGLKEGKDIEFCKTMSSKFYSLIPHDFGFAKMINFILDTETKIVEKLKMLQNLSDLQVATQTNERNNVCSDKVQANYDALDCTIEYIEKKTQEFNMIKNYFENTKGYHKSLSILEVYRIDKKKTFRDEMKNRMLLWHGSGIGNYVGILSKGLRIAPPEAPASGYLLGKGLYFADLLEKSANYIGTNSQNEGLVLLMDVALGNMNHLYDHNSDAANLPSGTHSVKCHGIKEPPVSSYVDYNMMKVPLGVPKNTKQNGVCHNEYVVYNTDQATFRYLIKIKY